MYDGLAHGSPFQSGNPPNQPPLATDGITAWWLDSSCNLDRVAGGEQMSTAAQTMIELGEPGHR